MLYAIPLSPELDKLEQHIAKISEDITQSVVHIKVDGSLNNKKFNSMGSGFVIDKTGLILTNHHVIDNSIKVLVKFNNDAREYEAKVIGSDEATDVALIQVNANEVKNLHPALLGKSKATKVGQWVLAVGNPYGLDRTVSFGIVSAKGRNMPQAPVLNDFIQTDAFIAPGSSGGPLLNMHGEVIGINSRGGSGLAFTIPIETALDVKEKLLKGGSIKRGFLGIQLMPLDLDMRKHLGISDTEGVLVTLVLKSSNFLGKLQPLDIIRKVNGIPLNAVEEKDVSVIIRRMSELPIGKDARIEILRKGKFLTIVGSVKERPPAEGKKWQSPMGFVLMEISDDLADRQQLEEKTGAYVSFIDNGSAAQQSQLRTGDVILNVDGKAIRSIDDAKEAFTANKKEYLLQVSRARAQFYLLLKP
ncbi:MAG: Periplasmic serine endoprotease DegP [Turneriella sp.]|nr:Periplasmic serine endoprotease DegP [Turneriella sp.]